MKQILPLCVEGIGVDSALRGVTATLTPGRLIGVVGPNGAGKTTLLRCLVGDLKPTVGVVTLGARPMRLIAPSERARQLTYLPQVTPISFPFTLGELVGLGAATPEAMALALGCMELEGLVSRSLLSLSGGERQRAALARALAQATPILVLDEPLAHLDPRYQSRLLEFCVGHCHQGGMVVLALHDLRLAKHWCEWVLLLNDGELCAEGPPRDVLTERSLQDIFGVTQAFVG